MTIPLRIARRLRLVDVRDQRPRKTQPRISLSPRTVRRVRGCRVVGVIWTSDDALASALTYALLGCWP